MPHRRFSWKLAPAVLGCSLLLGGLARADVADGPPPAVKDMSTMAHPDMTTPSNESDDGGCSVAQHGQPAGLALVLGGSAAALFLTRRRRA